MNRSSSDGHQSTMEGEAATPLRRKGRVRTAWSELRDPALLAWGLYILLFPVYVIPNGLPQPGDLLVLALAPLAFSQWDGRLPRSQRLLIQSLLLFIAYVVIVNLFWSTALNAWSINLKKGFALSPVFYIYNVLVFVVALITHRRYGERFFFHTGRFVVTSVVLQTLISMFYSRSTSRGTVLFNNPNQLGYYAVISAVIILLVQQRARMSTLWATIGLLAASYLALFSASKAALAAMVIVLSFGLFGRVRTMLLTAILGITLVIVAEPVTHILHKASARMKTPDELSFAEGRGYDRILEHPEDWLFGAGEGNYIRYRTAAQGSHELHSSFGTLFFCYGIIGTSLFLMFALRTFKGAPFRHLVLVLPALAYGLSHQGLRSTLAWVLFALFATLKTPAPPVGLTESR